VTQLRDKVDITADGAIAADEAHLHITLQDERVERHVVHALGSLEVPMTDEQLEQKFLDQVTLVMGPSVGLWASEAAWALGDTKDVLPFMHSFSGVRK
jgi:aconitate decarboxylase